MMHYLLSKIQQLEQELNELKSITSSFSTGDFNLIQKGGIADHREQRKLVQITGSQTVNGILRYSWTRVRESTKNDGSLDALTDEVGTLNASEVNGGFIQNGTVTYLNPPSTENGQWYIDRPNIINPCCILFNTGSRTLLNAVKTKLFFDTNRKDTNGFYLGVGDGRIQIPVGLGGVYLVGANIRWANQGYLLERGLSIDNDTQINTMVEELLEYPYVSNPPPGAINPQDQSISGVCILNDGDKISCNAYKDNGQQFQDIISVNLYSQTFWAVKIG